LTFVTFDVLSADGTSVMSLPYAERRAILENLGLNALCWRTPEAFDDGAALWEAVREHELEGVVAKKRSGRYLSGDRGWIKTKNRELLALRTRTRVGDQVAERERLRVTLCWSWHPGFHRIGSTRFSLSPPNRCRPKDLAI
jgi:ATP-dependent DNA ligase